MGKLLIFSEFAEIRELLSQELVGDGPTLIATGNPALMRELLRNFGPDLMLMDFHLSKINPWQLMRPINKESPRLLVLPYTAYSDQDGNLRLLLADPKGGKNLTLEAFKGNLDSFLNPAPIPGDGESKNQASHGESETEWEKFFTAPPAERANPFNDFIHKRRTQK